MTNKKKIAVYVDGFNLYHALKNLKKPHLKWLNIRSLVEKFINHQNEVIEKIYYFSAIATHLDNDTITRHNTYIEALETVGVDFIGGNFKKKCHKYKNNHLELKLHKHEEKETDVNISIYIVRDAIRKMFDKVFLITNDTDIVPAVKMAKNENNALPFRLLTPPTFDTHDSLRTAINPGKSTKLTEGHIQLSLLPPMITKPNGKIIHRPKEYNP